MSRVIRFSNHPVTCDIEKQIVGTTKATGTHYIVHIHEMFERIGIKFISNFDKIWLDEYKEIPFFSKLKEVFPEKVLEKEHEYPMRNLHTWEETLYEFGLEQVLQFSNEDEIRRNIEICRAGYIDLNLEYPRISQRIPDEDNVIDI